MFEEEPKEGYDDLIEAVTEAVKGSEKVREVLYQMYKEKAISPKTLLALFLKMQVCFAEEQDCQESAGGKKDYVDKIQVSPFTKNLENRSMTPEEEAFEEYYSERFDEERWLKELGIRFEN